MPCADGHASLSTRYTKVRIQILLLGVVLITGLVVLGVIKYHWRRSSTPVCSKCPANYIHHNGKCYLFSSSKKTWEQSRDYCATIGGNLAIIKNKEEQDFLVARVKEGQYFWIGLNDLEAEGQWHWVDGTSLKGTGAVFWFDRSQLNEPSEPDNWTQQDPLGEDCGLLSWADWRDMSCKQMYRFICETLGSFS
ncbi:CD209 antigen-like protein E [Engraulis encrasicolus]|uniref:CD209 antigen-like protein E n=1 Tax=Engraulis encrasicolus TaxID=184585 RepID=UPI002FD2F555